MIMSLSTLYRRTIVVKKDFWKHSEQWKIELLVYHGQFNFTFFECTEQLSYREQKRKKSGKNQIIAPSKLGTPI